MLEGVGLAVQDGPACFVLTSKHLIADLKAAEQAWICTEGPPPRLEARQIAQVGEVRFSGDAKVTRGAFEDQAVVIVPCNENLHAISTATLAREARIQVGERLYFYFFHARDVGYCSPIGMLRSADVARVESDGSFYVNALSFPSYSGAAAFRIHQDGHVEIVGLLSQTMTASYEPYVDTDGKIKTARHDISGLTYFAPIAPVLELIRAPSVSGSEP